MCSFPLPVYRRPFLSKKRRTIWEKPGLSNFFSRRGGFCTLAIIRDFKMPRRRRQRERKKSNRLNRQNNNSARASRFLYISLPSLHDYDVFSVFKFYGGLKHKTTIFFFFLWTFNTVLYNHGQKSWDTFAFLGRFPIHSGPTPPLTPQTMLDACIPNFFRVSTFYRVGGGRTARKFRKECTVLRGNREMTEKYEYCSTVPRTFVQDCRFNS